MLSKKITVIAFVLVAALQLYVPASMISGRDSILSSGKEYKFKTAPVDPYDPFRGKYITLDFAENTFKGNADTKWERGETVFLLLSKDTAGYAKIVGAGKSKPSSSKAFLKAKVAYDSYDGSFRIDYPFDRYYMEESKAPDAERIYRERNVDSSQVAYALVSIKNGEAVLKDVLINNVSIKEIVSKPRKP